MMDGAYFTSRKDVLDFINSQLSLQLTKIEQTASGAVACQLTEYMFPGSLNLSRVNWEAKSEYEFINNYKLLQDAFNKHNVQRFVDVPKLVRGKYQDNLEFMQWFKAFFDQSAVTRDSYDPVEARSKGKGGKDVKKHFDRAAKEAGSKLLPSDRQKDTVADAPPTAPASSSTSSSSSSALPAATAPHQRPALKDASNVAPAAPSAKQHQPAAAKKEVREPPAAPAAPAAKPASAKAQATNQSESKGSSSSSSSRPGSKKADTKAAAAAAAPVPSSSAGPSPPVVVSKESLSLLSQNAELRTTIEGLEKERDFYFDKLRDVEIMLQAFQEKVDAKEKTYDAMGDKLIGDVFKVLYATTDDKVKVSDDGELIGA